MISMALLLLVDLFAGLNFGCSISNLSTQIIKMYSKNGHVSSFDPESNVITSLLSVSVLIGSMVGSMSCTYFMERFGRKHVAIVSSVLAAVLNGLTIIPVHWGYLFAMRVLLGIPASALTTTIPVWLSELASTAERGVLTVCFQLFICGGIIVSALLLLAIGTRDDLYWISFLGTLVPCVCSAICCCFLPDSKKAKDD